MDMEEKYYFWYALYPEVSKDTYAMLKSVDCGLNDQTI
jgi:hypothetical protein